MAASGVLALCRSMERLVLPPSPAGPPPGRENILPPASWGQSPGADCPPQPPALRDTSLGLDTAQ